MVKDFGFNYKHKMRVNKYFARRILSKQKKVVQKTITDCKHIGPETEILYKGIKNNRVYLQELLPTLSLAQLTNLALHFLNHIELVSEKELVLLFQKINNLLECHISLQEENKKSDTKLTKMQEKVFDFEYPEKIDKMDYDFISYSKNDRVSQAQMDKLFQIFQIILSYIDDIKKRKKYEKLIDQFNEYLLFFECVWFQNINLFTNEQIQFILSNKSASNFNHLEVVIQMISEKDIPGIGPQNDKDLFKQEILQKVFYHVDIKDKDFSLKNWDFEHIGNQLEGIRLINKINGKEVNLIFYQNRHETKLEEEYQKIRDFFQNSNEMSTLIIDKSPVSQELDQILWLNSGEHSEDHPESLEKHFKTITFKEVIRGREIDKYFYKFILKEEANSLIDSKIYSHIFQNAKSFDFNSSVEFSFLKDNKKEYEPKIIHTGFSLIEKQSKFLNQYSLSEMKEVINNYNFSSLVENYNFLKKVATNKCKRCGGENYLPKAIDDLMENESNFNFDQAIHISVMKALQETIYGFKGNVVLVLPDTSKNDFLQGYLGRLAELDKELFDFFSEERALQNDSNEKDIFVFKRSSNNEKQVHTNISSKYEQISSVLRWTRYSFIHNEFLVKNDFAEEHRYDLLEKFAIGHIIFGGCEQQLLKFNLGLDSLPKDEAKNFNKYIDKYRQHLSMETFLGQNQAPFGKPFITCNDSRREKV